MFSSTRILFSWSWVMMKSSFTTIAISATVVSTPSGRSGVGAGVAGRIATGCDCDPKFRSTTSAPVADRPVTRSTPALKLLSSGSPLPATRTVRPATGAKSMTY